MAFSFRIPPFRNLQKLHRTCDLPKNAEYYFSSPKIPRGFSAEELFNKAKKLGLKGKQFKSIKKAYRSALNKADSDDLVFVGGSTFVVAEVL